MAFLELQGAGAAVLSTEKGFGLRREELGDVTKHGFSVAHTMRRGNHACDSVIMGISVSNSARGDENGEQGGIFTLAFLCFHSTHKRESPHDTDFWYISSVCFRVFTLCVLSIL